MDLNVSIRTLLSQKKHPVVFVAGWSGSGKTTAAYALAKQYPGAQVIELDWYLTYSSAERKRLIIQKVIPAEPQTWYSWDTFTKGIERLRDTGTLTLSGAWGQKTGEKDLDVSLDFGGRSGLIICEGIFLLHPEVTKFADVILLMGLDAEEAQRRSNERDSHRNDSEYVAFKETLRDTYDKPYFERFKNNADMTIDVRGGQTNQTSL